MMSRALGLIVASLASSAVTAAEPAAQLEWSVNTALAHTDNVTLVDTDPISETIGSVGGSIDLRREGSRLNATLRGAGAYSTYFDNTYDDDFLGSAAASLLFGIISDRLTWTLDNTFGQATTNEFEPSTPDNRGNVNVLSTGPDLRLLLGSATELVVTARYENETYQEAGNVDSHSWIGGAAVVHRVSPAVAWSLNAAASRNIFDATGNQSYNQQELYAQLQSSGAQQTLTAALGIGFLDQGDQTEQTPLARINWTRTLTPSWSLALDASSEYKNAGDQFVTGVADGDDLGGTQDIILTDQVPRNDTAGLRLSFERPRTTLRFSGGLTREDYSGSSSLDRDTWALGASASRQITQRLEASLATSYEERTFSGMNEDDKTTTFSARVDWRLGKAIFVGLQGGMQRRSGDTEFSYDETVYQASLSYRPSGR